MRLHPMMLVLVSAILCVQSVALDSSRSLQQQTELSSIVELAVATPALSTLAYVLTQPAYAGILEALSGPGPFTVFAPTDAAFAAAFTSTGIDVSNTAVITSVLQYHVLAGAVPSSALRSTQTVATLQGERVVVTKTAVGVFVNGDAKVVAADVMASNGVVHVIDSVLLPPSLMAPAPATPAASAASAVPCTVTMLPTLMQAQRAATACGCDPAGAHEMSAGNFMVSHGCRDAVNAATAAKAAPAVPVASAALAAPAGPKSIVELAIATPELSTLVAVLTMPAYAGVLEALSGPGPFTVFAPTDAAFAKAGVDVSDVAAVTAVLKYHVLGGSAPTSAMGPAQSAQTLQGESMIIMMSAEGVTINGNSKVVIADVMASNGVVHVVDSVLKPPSLMTIVDLALVTPSLSSLKTVLTLPEYAPVLAALSGAGPFTVFAPTDAAFAKAGVDVYDVPTVTAVLQYHVLSGAITSSALATSQSVPTLQGEAVSITKTPAGVFVNGGAKVLLADAKAANGIVHVVDTLLVPPSLLASAAAAKVAPAPATVAVETQKSIVELAVATPELSTLVYVLTQPAYAGVLEALSGPGPFTVFAPTDAAFATAFAQAGVNISDVATITAVLKYHVVSGAVPSSALRRAQSVTTLQGEAMSITKTSAGVIVNGNAKVVIADVMASNGVVHVVDSVLLPPSFLAPVAPIATVAPVSRVASAAPQMQYTGYPGSASFGPAQFGPRGPKYSCSQCREFGASLNLMGIAGPCMRGPSAECCAGAAPFQGEPCVHAVMEGLPRAYQPMVTKILDGCGIVMPTKCGAAPAPRFAPQAYAPQGFTPQGYAPQGYAPQGYAPQQGMPQQAMPQQAMSAAPQQAMIAAPQVAASPQARASAQALPRFRYAMDSQGDTVLERSSAGGY
jgi:transforming growth factor-beta-induced protein